MNQVINSIKGSVNVVTGAARGLGRETLRRFLLNDCGPVLCIDNHFDEDFLSKLELDDGRLSKLTLKQQNTFDESIESSLEEFVSKHGTIDNLLNIAGVTLTFAMYHEQQDRKYELEHCDNLLKFNTYGAFNMCRLASKYMIREGGGKTTTGKISQTKNKCIINASCTSTTCPTYGHSFYAGSKSAIDSMTLCLARELAPYNIRCNTLNVGFFDTHIVQATGEHLGPYLNRISLLRLGKPEEFAHFVHKIVENQMINGACIRIDSGTRMGNKW